MKVLPVSIYGIVLLFLCALLSGCSENDSVSPRIDSVSSPMTLSIVSDNGQMIVRSPDGETYTEESLKEAMILAAQEGRNLKITTLNRSLKDGYEDISTHSLTAPPNSSNARIFISDVNAVSDGVAVTLTDTGLSLGLSWGGAGTLASYTMAEYGLQERSYYLWPFWLWQTIQYQVQLEMFYHSLAFYYWHSPRFRTVNVVFADLP